MAIVALLMAMAVPTAVVAAGDGPAPKLTLVSRSDGSHGGALSGVSREASVSPEGRYVSFNRFDGAESALYLRDLRNGRTRVLSQLGEYGGDASFSVGGRYVAYSAPPPGAKSSPQVYMLDTRTGSRVLLSHWYVKDPPAAKSGNYAQGGAGATISANGRYVAFVSGGTNLVDESGPAFEVRRHAPGEVFTDTSQVYVRDVKKGRTVLASRASGRNGVVADAGASEAQISADGRYVVFVSYSANLDRGGPTSSDARSDVYVRDLRTNRTTVVSRGGAAGGRFGHNTEPSISARARFIAFDGAEGIVVRNLQGGSGYLVGGTEPVSKPVLSADGRALAYLVGAEGRPEEQKLFLRELHGGKPTFVHSAGNHGGAPSLSADGRRVVFDTYTYYEVEGRGPAQGKLRPDTGSVFLYQSP
jgi:Tol biopolymer transport system component